MTTRSHSFANSLPIGALLGKPESNIALPPPVQIDKLPIKLVQLSPQYAKPLAKLQRICYPTCDPEELFQEKHFLVHCQRFPEGTFVALCEDVVVGMGAGILRPFDFDNPEHDIETIMGDSYYSGHQPDGDYYYGTDISVHPDFRRHGIGSLIYAARKDLVRRLNKRGIVAGGFLPGYAKYKHTLSCLEYVQKVAAQELYDPTLSFQLHKQGFQLRGVLPNYMVNTASNNYASLIYWENPDYQPGSK